MLGWCQFPDISWIKKIITTWINNKNKSQLIAVILICKNSQYLSQSGGDIMHSDRLKYKYLLVYLWILVLHCEESMHYIHLLEHTADTLHPSLMAFLFCIQNDKSTLTHSSLNRKSSPHNFLHDRLASQSTVKNQKALCKSCVGHYVSACKSGRVWDEVLFMQHIWRFVYVSVTSLRALIRGGGVQVSQVGCL